jgi:hypothetical protein
MPYRFLLDLFPTLAPVAAEQPVLAAFLEQEALELLLAPSFVRVERVELLLLLARDLNLVDDVVHSYLARDLMRIRVALEQG